jgi:hypothetical protein
MEEAAQLTECDHEIMDKNELSKDVTSKPNGADRRYSTPLLIIIGALLLYALFQAFGPGRNAPVSEIAPEAGAARSARIHLQLGLADLRLDAAGSARLLIEGDVDAGRGETITENHSLRGGVADYRLTSRRIGPGWLWPNPASRWNLHLNPRLPTELSIDGGVGRLDLDLAAATLTGLDLDLGVGGTTVRLPGSGPLQVRISAGVGAVDLRVPRGAPVRLSVDTGLGQVSVSGDLQRNGNTWTSASYASNRNSAIDIRIDGGVGAITVETY